MRHGRQLARSCGFARRYRQGTCAKAVLIAAKKRPWSAQLQTIFADGGFAGEECEAQVQEQLGWKLHIVHRDKEQTGFVPLPKRWLIEQLFG